MVSWKLRQGVANGRGESTALPIPGPNHPVEWTAHSVGSVSLRGSVPVGRRSARAFGFSSHFALFCVKSFL
jgi:hypothetical protein